jgi:prepilin-type N-terminal cleavage/methylation domain-containing protein
MNKDHTASANGFTLIELLVALALGAILFAGLNGIVGQALHIHDSVRDKNNLTRQTRFAMQRMEQAVGNTRLLMLPLNDNPNTTWPENEREETVPASAPPAGSSKATAVLAATINPTQDLDGDGTPDADNDGDGQIDEDIDGDRTNDTAAGIYLIDDDGDGSVDESTAGYWDDDEESSTWDEDPVNGIDDDGDGTVDEDSFMDMNADNCPGTCGVDNDNDGQVDEGSTAYDDDEDGLADEDWYDPVVFYLAGGTLMERTWVPWDESGADGITGRDFIIEPIAENVTRFRVERVPQNGDRSQIVDLTLELTNPLSGETVSLNTRVRVGGEL